MDRHTSMLSEKIRTLSPEQIAEVESFVEFLCLRAQDRSLTQTAAAVSTPAFETIWANPEDDAYDAL